MAQRQVAGQGLELVACQHCGQRVAVINLGLHELRCDRNARGATSSAPRPHPAASGSVAESAPASARGPVRAASVERPCHICSYLNPVASSECEVCEAPLPPAQRGSARLMFAPREGAANDTERSADIMPDNAGGVRDMQASSREGPVSSARLVRPTSVAHRNSAGVARTSVSAVASGEPASQRQSQSQSARPQQGGAAADGAQRATWRCSRCTFENDEFSLACDMCRSRRNQDSRVRRSGGAAPGTGSSSRGEDLVAGGLLGAVLGGLAGSILSSAMRGDNESAGSAAMRGAGTGALLGALSGAMTTMFTDELVTEPASATRSGSNSSGAPQAAARRTSNYGADDILSSSYERLMEMFPPPSGPRPPADREAVDELPTQEIRTEEQLRQIRGGASTDGRHAHEAQCSICLMSFEVGDTVKWLPCTHVYHSTCVDRWLGQSNSCPVCTHEVHV
ncbi:E3 ubiquitin-protein ligase [Porphyridium purpureum]|uniref:E3 ubiquitin-protein ligase n=1 Tax=Porphyridium purpureum TaxID=35688 RepID=A0A5J4YHZ5_PORPP|nr:E3 ubiquitin-protein ligase [Porphyridium purpureum]|eukprot:POR7825..scf297_16